MQQLDILPAEQVAAIEGYISFLQVFGRRIQFEYWNEEGYEFCWKWSLPEIPGDAFLSFSHPEILQQGSDAHWIVTTWCANPRTGKSVGWPPGELNFQRPSLPLMESKGADEVTVESVREYVHQQFHNFDPLQPFLLDEEEKAQLVWAKRRLRDAVTVSAEIGRPYRTVFARILYGLGEFHEAGEEYARAFSERFLFRPDVGKGEDYSWELSFMTALCFRYAGELERAISALQPDPGRFLMGSNWWIARWYSEEGYYDLAADQLVEQSETPLSIPESWQLSTVLALAKLSHSDDTAERFAERLAKTNPEMEGVIVGLTEQLWPSFGMLSKESKAHWLHGIAELHRAPLFPGAQGISANTAIKDFEWIVEHELRTKLFGSFRSAASSGETREMVNEDYRKNSNDLFLRFLVASQPRITLGAMLFALEDCQNPRLPTYHHFRGHVASRSRQVFSKLIELKEIKQYRDPAVHTDRVFQKSDALRMERKCRGFLDTLLLSNQG
jgi:hypothetical protein